MLEINSGNTWLFYIVGATSGPSTCWFWWQLNPEIVQKDPVSAVLIFSVILSASVCFILLFEVCFLQPLGAKVKVRTCFNYDILEAWKIHYFSQCVSKPLMISHPSPSSMTSLQWLLFWRPAMGADLIRKELLRYMLWRGSAISLNFPVL